MQTQRTMSIADPHEHTLRPVWKISVNEPCSHLLELHYVVRKPPPKLSQLGVLAMPRKKLPRATKRPFGEDLIWLRAFDNCAKGRQALRYYDANPIIRLPIHQAEMQFLVGADLRAVQHSPE